MKKHKFKNKKIKKRLNRNPSVTNHFKKPKSTFMLRSQSQPNHLHHIAEISGEDYDSDDQHNHHNINEIKSE